MNQGTLINTVTGNVQIFNVPNPFEENRNTESKGNGVPVRFEHSLEKEIEKACKETRMNKSEFIREACEVYVKLYRFRNQIHTQWEALVAWLKVIK